MLHMESEVLDTYVKSDLKCGEWGTRYMYGECEEWHNVMESEVLDTCVESV